MTYKKAYFLVEGDDEVRYINRIVRPKLEEIGCYVQTWKYTQKRWGKRRNFVKSIDSMKGCCFYFADIDQNPCLVNMKNTLSKKLCPWPNCCNVIIVIKEIEGWYIAGSTAAGHQGISANEIIKEQFDKMIPRGETRTEFIQEILQSYDLCHARTRNSSLDHFIAMLETEALATF